MKLRPGPIVRNKNRRRNAGFAICVTGIRPEMRDMLLVIWNSVPRPAPPRHYLEGLGGRCFVASADETGLGNAQASVVYGEAILTMQGQNRKLAIIAEARRLLRPGGRYGIHELCLVPDELPRKTRDLIEHDLARTIHVGARPLTTSEWRELLIGQGFEIEFCSTAPMHLLELPRLIRDEGLWRALLIASRLFRGADVRARMLAMKEVFRRHGPHLRAITVVGRKP